MITIRNFECGDAAALQLAVYTERSVEEIEEMINRWNVKQFNGKYSEKLAAEIDTEVKSIIDNAYDRCTKILTENMTKLHNVAQALFEKEKISGEEFVEIFEKDEKANEEISE